ncbi:MAG TPA: amidophosphoribosyltransferase, partial [Bacteroidales bacterium]|nr:amidophosphoribosyltransferase [Bacteroidales bacterium]
KPMEYYLGKYGTAFFALNKMQLLMEKQHNRGQDGAGIACIKFDPQPGMRYINRVRSDSDSPIMDIFRTIHNGFNKAAKDRPEVLNDVQWLKRHVEFSGELFLGHLRYGTFGGHGINAIHPIVRENNWLTRNLVLAGNFNMTNVDELFSRLVNYGQFPTETSDTVTILEKIGHFLDEENERLYQEYRAQGYEKREITRMIAQNIDIPGILQHSSKYWDGGYVIAGLFGHGDAFVMRDPAGIRPAFFYQDEEVVVAASERPVIQTALNVKASAVQELQPGHALIMRRNGTVTHCPCRPPAERRSCSFERIYFSRGTDQDIYQERKALGRSLTPTVLEAIDHDLVNTVFSYIPNTAAVAFYGMMEALDDFCDRIKMERILQLRQCDEAALKEILALRPRAEKIAVKDVKMRTFITQDTRRDDLVTHVYDVTYGVVRDGLDNLVVLDDSIVRGTTLRQSIIRILDRLNPKQIVIASSAPQIRYPDCYGIDMAKLHDFVAFNAVIALLHETGRAGVINEVYKKCKAQEHKPKEEIVNHVKDIYRPFSVREISERIAKIVTPPEVKSRVVIVYQSIEDLHRSCPEHLGDWYFTGDYPTPGGNKVVNQAFINYIEGRNLRAY